MQTSMVTLAVQLSCMVLPWQLQGVLKANLLYKQFYRTTPIDYPISTLQLRTTYSVNLLNNITRRTVLYIAGISLVAEINVSHHSYLMMWMTRRCRVSSKQYWCETTAQARGRVLRTDADVCCIRFRCRLLSLVVYVWHRQVWICCNGYWHTVDRWHTVDLLQRLVTFFGPVTRLVTHCRPVVAVGDTPGPAISATVNNIVDTIINCADGWISVQPSTTLRPQTTFGDNYI